VVAAALVARSLAASLAPAERGTATPPSWLLPGQARGVRRLLAALDRYGGALLADAVGSGKTYVALAVAALRQPGRPVACLVPATLADQWRAVAARVGVAVEVGTHQQASRGRLPQVRRGLVIIDESHHLRNPRTHRYLHLAPWLVGRPVLLLSATPIVNRMDDLAHQLLLGVRDDALLADGIVSIRGVLASGQPTAALGHLVLEETSAAGPRPARRVAASLPGKDENARAARAIDRLTRLRLSLHPPTAAIIRAVLLRALASSPPALAGALRRYRHLLLHARDARRAGRRLSRAELRAFAGPVEEQLVLWELLAGGPDPDDLALDDLERIDEVLASAGLDSTTDAKMQRLRDLLADGHPTLVFASHRETVRHLRDKLSPPLVAWCTGDRAGLGHLPAPRAAVLDWFRDERRRDGPQCLVVTDVAAEGLDLRRAARVVHYDLPWTPMRIEQREGRAVRLGSMRAAVEVVRFELPAPLDAALKLGTALERKSALPARAGLGERGRQLWRWRSELADHAGGGPSAVGTAAVRSADAGTGVLAGYELVAPHLGGVTRLAAVVGWLDACGRWVEDQAVVSARLTAALMAESSVPAAARVALALDRLAGPIRAHLARVSARRWSAADPDPAARRLAVALGRGVREAARRRDAGALARLERALAFAAGGHTAGEALLVRRLADADARTLASALVRLPAPTPRWDVVEVRLTGLVLFER
jgi:superfamily II DNA or RNA helicase